MTLHRNIVFSITLLTVAAATMFYGVSTIHETNNNYTCFPEQQQFVRPPADNQTVYTNYSTKQLSISQQHRISHKAMQSSQRSSSPHSLYQHSSAMTASSCVAVPLQPSTNNITTDKGHSSMSERTYSLVLPSLQRGSIIAGTPSVAPYLAVASTPQSATPLVQYAPVIGEVQVLYGSNGSMSIMLRAQQISQAWKHGGTNNMATDIRPTSIMTSPNGLYHSKMPTPFVYYWQ